MRNNRFNFKRTFTQDLGASWPATGVSLANMMWMFYHVRNFRVQVSGITLGGSGIDLLVDPTAGLDIGGGVGAAGLSQRRCENPPDILNQLDDAFKLTLVDKPNPDDVKKYGELKTKAQSTAAPGEPHSFLRAIDVNTCGVYPIFYFTGSGVTVRIDFGSTKKIGDTFFPACYAIVGTDGVSIDGLYILGYITVVGMGGLQIPIYSSSGALGTVSGTMTPYEVYSDLEFSPAEGPGGTVVKIAMPEPDASVTDITKQKVFSGFHNVIQASYDGFDITSSINKTSTKVGTDPTTHKDIINETCSVTIPQTARSGYFAFVCEGKDDYGVKTFDQFTIPKRFITTDFPTSLTSGS